LAFLVVWQIFLWIDLPRPNTDGPWSLGQTFAMLRGELLREPLGYDFQETYLRPYMYGVLTAPFFAVYYASGLPGEYSIFLFHQLLLLCAIAVVAYVLRLRISADRLMGFGVLVAMLCSPYSMLLRYEMLNVLLIAVILLVLSRAGTRPSLGAIAAVSLLSSLVGLVHAVGGLFLLLLVPMIAAERKYGWRFAGWFLLLTFIFGVILYGPVVAVSPERWWSQMSREWSGDGQGRGFDVVHLWNYAKTTPFFVAVAGAILVGRRKRFLFEGGGLAAVLMFLSFMGASRYFPYVIPFIVWRAADGGLPSMPRPVLVLILALTPLFSHYLPTYRQLENREYVHTYTRALDQVRGFRSEAESARVWVPFTFAMPLIDKPGARAHRDGYSFWARAPLPIEPGEAALIERPEDFNTMERESGVDKERFSSVQVLPFTRGLRQLDGFNLGRTDSIGLIVMRRTEMTSPDFMQR
jgi:hypothetical protein